MCRSAGASSMARTSHVIFREVSESEETNVVLGAEVVVAPLHRFIGINTRPSLTVSGHIPCHCPQVWALCVSVLYLRGSEGTPPPCVVSYSLQVKM